MNVRKQGNNVIGQVDMTDTRFFQIPPENLRDIAQRRMVTSGPGLDTRYMPSSDELETINE